MISQKIGSLADHWTVLFRDLFDNDFSPLIVRSPGRVNLIGEHTDYNEGFVLPAALDKAIYFAIAPRNDMSIRLYSVDMKEWEESNVRALTHSDKRWPNYLFGIVDQLIKAGYEFNGFDCLFGGNVPIGAGLSSSAAIEGGLIFALNEIFHLKLDKMSMVKLAQKAENEFVGVRCGIMDQFINIFGENKKVLRLDCRSMEYEHIPFERTDLSIILCETKTRRELASSEYNVRRLQCEEGVRILSTLHPHISSLRDVSLEMLADSVHHLSPTVYRRCDYVVKENIRVLNACKDLQNNDFTAFGKRMFESHAGLSKDYEVSCRELDVLVEAASKIKGVLGSRMMGAGFGGCTINLVEEDSMDLFTTTIQQNYKKIINDGIVVHIAKLETGTNIIH